MKNKEKKDFLILKIIAYLVIYIILFLLVINTVIGYINFNNIENEQKLYFINNTTIHKTDEEVITSYRFGIYKIISIKRQESISYNLKLWFNKDF